MFRLIFSSKAEKQLDALPKKDRKQYEKAFDILAKSGPIYKSLRTHRYKHKSCNTWGSSASMAKRFYWEYIQQSQSEENLDEKIIIVTSLSSH